MTMPQWYEDLFRGRVTTINLQDLINRINTYRRDLGIPFKTLTPGDTPEKLQQEITSLTYQWEKTQPAWKRGGLFKPAPLGETLATTTAQPTTQPETTKGQGLGGDTKVESRGGYDFLYIKDENGQWQFAEVLGKSGQTGQMTERERSFLALEQQQLGRLGIHNQPNVAKKQAEEFELWRNRMLSQLSGPANEVARWFVQHKENPYEQMMWSPAGGYEALGQAYATAQDRAESQNLPGGGMTPAEQQLQTATLSSAVARTVEEEEAVREYEREKNLAQSVFQRGPETPGWVSEFAPAVGKTLPLDYGLGAVPPPSGQQLTKMTPGQSEWLGGTMDWFGKQRWEDLMAKAAVMQPRTPRGAGGSRWSPARSV